MSESAEELKATADRLCPHCQAAFYQVGGLNQRVVEDTAERVIRKVTCWSCKEGFLFVTFPPKPY